MRIIILVIVAYVMLFSLASLIKSLIVKRAKKYNFSKDKRTKNAVMVIDKKLDSKTYWKINFFHFINVIVLAFIIFMLVTL